MGTDGIITGITRQDWLQPAEERLQKLLHATFASGGRGGQKIKNVLHGIAGGLRPARRIRDAKRPIGDLRATGSDHAENRGA